VHKLESFRIVIKSWFPVIMSFFLESNPERRSLLDNANVLIDEGIEIEGLLACRGWGWRWAPSPPPIRQVRKDGASGPSYDKRV
jgi:hypothetical protein